MLDCHRVVAKGIAYDLLFGNRMFVLTQRRPGEESSKIATRFKIMN